MFRDKMGQDKMISMYWFFILFIVAVAIVYMVSLFHNHPIDVREVEAGVLANKVADCISREGKLTDAFYSAGVFNPDFEENFENLCNFNFEVESDFGGEDQYYVGVEVYEESSPDVLIFEANVGNLNLIANCKIDEGNDYEKVAKCVQRRIYSVGEGKQFLIEITTVVDKNEKNVKL